MNSTARVQTPSGQRALLITALAVSLTGWTIHAVALHRRLAAIKRDPLTGLLRRAAYTARARRILARRRESAVVLVSGWRRRCAAKSKGTSTRRGY